jgi:uncharacterized protein YbbC (DUF1343 family)
MTPGEYALMVNGEGWLANGMQCDLTVVELDGYDHHMVYHLPVPPSPNLPDWRSVYLYPSLGLFEGTFMSVGRGTDFPFRVIGHPDFMIGSFAFTPQSIPGVAENPPFEGIPCYGQNLTGYAENIHDNEYHFSLQFLISAHEYFKDSTNFFNSYFQKLAGNDSLKEQIIHKLNESQIREYWQPEVDQFIKTRKKYLLYPDASGL